MLKVEVVCYEMFVSTVME